MNLTPAQLKLLEDLGFTEGVTRHKSDNSRMFDFINGNMMMTVFEDGSWGLSNLKTHTTCGKECLSGKFRSILAKLKEGGIE